MDFVPRLFELRSYTAHPGRRDELIGMFERVFLDAYEAAGARILGTFRSLDEPDRWVWIRAFADPASRGRALSAFYEGEVWRRNADACDALIASVDEARLLRQAHVTTVGAVVAFVSDSSENCYPRQPVRADSVYVTLTRCASHLELAKRAAQVEVMRLVPTPRSALR
jgi:hypothetical protein